MSTQGDKNVLKWLKGRKVTASVVALSVLVAVPVTVAVLHEGFPVTDVDLSARDVWVTNGTELMAGRLNRQIEELNASVATVSNDIDVLQNGEDVLLHDRSGSTVERVDSAFTTLIERADMPPGAELSLGDTKLSIVDPKTGELWITNTAGELRFSTVDTKPLAKLGDNAKAVVSTDGTTFAVSPEKKKLYAYPAGGGDPTITELPKLDDYLLTAAGEQAVILDRDKNRILTDATSSISLPDQGVKLQQVSATGGEVIVATGSSLLRVRLNDDSPQTIKAEITNPVTKANEISSPVNLNGCAHGAWSGASKYLAVCGEASPSRQPIEPLAEGATLEFRVNKNVIALNNLQTGDVWLVDANMRLVKNWEEVTPPQEDDGEEGDEKASTQSFEDTLADRTEQNRPPIARDDALGARPGKSTILPVLDNDTDPDGDVLTIGENLQGLAPESGLIEFIDGGRALQFTPNPEQSAGTISFRYSVSDGRTGGVAEATVSVTIMPMETNAPPVEQRKGAVSVEVGQSISYNPLIDWRDPDGDDVFLQSAVSNNGDLVRFSHEGFVTVTHTSAQEGPRDIVYVVSDGYETASGTFTVDVKPSGTLGPIGTPDHVQTFVGEPIDAFPLDNDLSTNGSQLALLGAEAQSGGLTITLKPDSNSMQLVAGNAGVYYVQYTLGAGAATSIGMLRVDVRDAPTEVQKPIAVHDTGYLRPNEPTSLNVLTNDVAPSGNVLAIRSLDIPDESRVLSIEVLNSSVIRVTSSGAVTDQLQFSYTLSDGTNEATTTVSIVPVPPLTKHQAPIAADDTVTVRAGDIASVPVLENDVHPDNAVMVLAPDLVEPSTGGLAFVTDDRVRYQAPRDPGVYTAAYMVTDAFKQQAVARVTFNVVGADKDKNEAPAPKTLTARVFADSSVEVNVPLDGLDPNGDSLVFDGLASSPALGSVTDSNSTTFTYTAAPGSAGTDVFSYTLKDTFGATAIGTVRIGVIQRAAQDSPPIAVDDTIEVQPGRVATVPVLGNDSDPNGYEIEVVKALKEVPEGVVATVKKKQFVEIEAPEEETTLSIRYEITNNNGGTDTAFVQVRVTKEATIEPPTLIDHIVEAGDVVGEKTVDIDVLKGANNSGGRTEDLEISIEGPNAASAENLGNGKVRVTLVDNRMAITYRLTNTIDDLSSAAFIVVPPFSDGLPPVMRDLPTQYVDKNATRTWKLDDIAMSPTGKKIKITDAKKVTSARSNGASSFVDNQTLTFTPALDYRGPANITFEATDGSSTGVATLVLPIIVGDPEMKDEPPTFTPPNMTIEANGEPQTLDLRAASFHQNPEVLADLAYSGLGGMAGGITADLSGSTITVSAPFGTPTGTAATLTFQVKYREFVIDGSVNVRVVASSRPMPSTVDDSEPNGRSSKAVTLNVLGNDYNPFPGQPLTIVDVQLSSGNASYTISGSNLIITPGPEKSQQISYIYTVQDATKDATRQAQGRADVVVTSAPDAPPAPTLDGSRSENISVLVKPSPSNNGAPITEYMITRTGGDKGSVTARGNLGAPVNFAGVNGVSYSFTVTAKNNVGLSAPSPSASAVSYGVPSKPGVPDMSRSGRYEGSSVTMEWAASSDKGGDPTFEYRWSITDGSSGSGTRTSATVSKAKEGTYSGTVQACSRVGCSDPVQARNSVAIEKEPPPPPPPPVEPEDKRTLSLKKGPDAGGGKFFYHITMTNWAPNTSYSWSCYANGSVFRTYSLTTNGNGGFDEAPRTCFSGFPDTKVIVADKESKIVDFRP
ncbi:fibronectin type III domain-containing protein [Mycetocola zhadangensis]|uniref:Fibronectin type III domain-containing protein n=1 Tax=Mycetocola zhadangensis TaxID=1164595 RepID=A0A3L7J4H7_9MICO|nr:fibronectin type III domain-containing protein [Mycetocola zhadangensis]GGE82084.1 fibronectin type III [Mycetocola zhadangensis]